MSPRVLLAAFCVLGGGGDDIETKKPGTEAPAFELAALDGKKVTSADLLGDAKEKNVLVVVFWSRQCPWVEHWNPDLDAIVQEYAKQPRVRFAVIDSDKNETDDPDAIAAYLKKQKFSFTVYVDKGNKVADAFGATTTPHCFVIGKERKLVYTGRINDARPLDANTTVRQKGGETPQPVAPATPLLRRAIVAALEGKSPEVTVDAPTGCRIKRQ